MSNITTIMIVVPEVFEVAAIIKINDKIRALVGPDMRLFKINNYAGGNCDTNMGVFVGSFEDFRLGEFINWFTDQEFINHPVQLLVKGPTDSVFTMQINK